MYNLWSFLYQTVAASAAAAFLLLIKRLFLDKLSPRWQYWVWSALLLRLVLPVGFLGRSGILDFTVPVDILRLTAELRLTSAWSTPWRSGMPKAPVPWLSAGAPNSVTDWLFAIYLLGVILCGLWLLLGWNRLRHSIKETAPVAGERLAFIQTAAEKFSLVMPQKVVESRAVRTPFLMGILHPTLVLPMGWEPDEKVVLHELLHLKYHDVAAGWVTSLFRCIHWCNPFLWYVFDRIGNDREALCDQRVLERLEGEDRRDYGRTLLSMAEDDALRVPGATTMANGAKNIRARIESIARFKTFPQGMGLASACMIVILSVYLAVGFPTQAQGAVPEWAYWLDWEGQLAYAASNRATTPAGALDAYAKAMYHQYSSPRQSFTYQAMVTPEEDMPQLWEGRNDGFFEGTFKRIEALDAAYRTGPMFRGLVSDGDGGYWTQMYFFRDEEVLTADGFDLEVGWQRQTLSLRPQKDGSWTVSPLSSATGLLEDSGLGGFFLRISERPVFYWTGEIDGIEMELWPDANVQVRDPYINGSTMMHQVFQTANSSGVRIYPFDPDLDAQFSSVNGTIQGRLTNTTDREKTVILTLRQDWNDVIGYTGCDGHVKETLAPGETVSIQPGGRGFSAANQVETGECVITEHLTAVYTDEMGFDHEVELTRGVNLE